MAHGTTWSLPASSGSKRLTGKLMQRYVDRTGRVLLKCRIDLANLFWPRDSSLAKFGPDYVPDLNVGLMQLELLQEAVESLLAQAEAWTTMSSRKPFSLELCASRTGQSLIFTIGPQPGRNVGRGKAECTVRYTDGTALVEWTAIVDETCVREMHTGLREALSVIGRDGI
jgi:hypothetical protein